MVVVTRIPVTDNNFSGIEIYVDDGEIIVGNWYTCDYNHEGNVTEVWDIDNVAAYMSGYSNYDVIDETDEDGGYLAACDCPGKGYYIECDGSHGDIIAIVMDDWN